MATATDTRVPLWRMTDEQLRCYAEDELIPWDRRKTAEMILANREQQVVRPAAFAAPTTHRR